MLNTFSETENICRNCAYCFSRGTRRDSFSDCPFECTYREGRNVFVFPNNHCVHFTPRDSLTEVCKFCRENGGENCDECDFNRDDFIEGKARIYD